ncbi:MAG TPA: hypothetical protein VFF98_14970, partial [Novosphingobium sp.]|nr:hypothetical protein [Novosphingobium sp.]
MRRVATMDMGQGRFGGAISSEMRAQRRRQVSAASMAAGGPAAAFDLPPLVDARERRRPRRAHGWWAQLARPGGVPALADLDLAALAGDAAHALVFAMPEGRALWAGSALAGLGEGALMADLAAGARAAAAAAPGPWLVGAAGPAGRR